MRLSRFQNWMADRNSFLLRVGTIATILAVAIDPFAQLIVRLNQRLQYFPSSSATTPFAHDHLADWIGTLKLSIELAMPEGFQRPLSNSINGLQFNCPSCNYTWDSLISLAICALAMMPLVICHQEDSMCPATHHCMMWRLVFITKALGPPQLSITLMGKRDWVMS
ncbi:hypothetical protein IWX91DRAFT_178365 [Phyllosticta citricarpa]